MYPNYGNFSNVVGFPPEISETGCDRPISNDYERSSEFNKDKPKILLLVRISRHAWHDSCFTESQVLMSKAGAVTIPP